MGDPTTPAQVVQVAAEAAAGGLPWAYAIAAGSLLCSGITALWLYLRHREKVNGALLREKDRALAEAERRADSRDKAFQEHLEHDLRLYRGQDDRRPKPRHFTGDVNLDAKRNRAESISMQLPADVLARIKDAIDRGEIPA